MWSTRQAGMAPSATTHHWYRAHTAQNIAISLFFSRLGSIPLLLTRKPKNVPYLMAKTYLKGLSLILLWLSRGKDFFFV